MTTSRVPRGQAEGVMGRVPASRAGARTHGGLPGKTGRGGSPCVPAPQGHCDPAWTHRPSVGCGGGGSHQRRGGPCGHSAKSREGVQEERRSGEQLLALTGRWTQTVSKRTVYRTKPPQLVRGRSRREAQQVAQQGPGGLTPPQGSLPSWPRAPAEMSISSTALLGS